MRVEDWDGTKWKGTILVMNEIMGERDVALEFWGGGGMAVRIDGPHVPGVWSDVSKRRREDKMRREMMCKILGV